MPRRLTPRSALTENPHERRRGLRRDVVVVGAVPTGVAADTVGRLQGRPRLESALLSKVQPNEEKLASTCFNLKPGFLSLHPYNAETVQNELADKSLESIGWLDVCGHVADYAVRVRVSSGGVTPSINVYIYLDIYIYG